jgi:hypothetical protein
MALDLLKRLKRLWLGTLEEGELNLYHLSPPSAEASARRVRKARQSIKKMGKKYLNVAFKKEPEATPRLASVSKIRNSRTQLN